MLTTHTVSKSSYVRVIASAVLLYAPWVGCGDPADASPTEHSDHPDACLNGTFEISAQVTFFGNVERPAAHCLARPLAPDSDGRVECTVTIEFGSDIDAGVGSLPERCDQLAGLDDTGRQTAAGKAICEVRQLVAVDGIPPEGMAGWYYDASDTLDERCRTRSGVGVVFTPSLLIPTGSLIQTKCNFAVDKDGEPVRSDACAQPEPSRATPKAQAAEVGMACEPHVVPQDGFDDRESLVLAGSGQCASNTCVVRYIEGTLDEPCGNEGEPRCVRPEELERIHCSCRCGVPDGVDLDDASLCTCPAGFNCTEVVPNGPDSVIGSYCVLNDSSRAGAGPI